MAAQEIFHLGERVRCLVMGMDDNFTRISLSTAELEEQNGDMLFDKVRHSSWDTPQALISVTNIVCRSTSWPVL